MRRCLRSPLVALVAALALLPALAGCGGALPIGHPAHALSAGKVAVGGGVAATVMAESTAHTAGPAEDRLQQLTAAPAMSPWAFARFGLGDGFEAGLSASSRALRIDARRAFQDGTVALSIGLGASALLAAQGTRSGDATAVYGGGFDLPVLVGWHSSADLYAVWAGPRIGADLLTGQLDGPAGVTQVSARHLHAGLLAGLRAGFRHLYGVLQVELDYHHADASFGLAAVQLDGLSVAPAGALVVSF